MGGYVKGSKPDTSYERNLESAAAPSVSCRVKVKDHEMEDIDSKNSDQQIEPEDKTDEKPIRLNESEDCTSTATIKKAILPKVTENEERDQGLKNKNHSPAFLLGEVAPVVKSCAFACPRIFSQGK